MSHEEGGGGLPKIVIFESKSAGERKFENLATVRAIENRLSDSERGEDYLSGSIQHIYKLTCQSSMRIFKV